MTQGALSLTILFSSFVFFVLALFFTRFRLFFLTIGLFIGLTGFYGVYSHLLPQPSHTRPFPRSIADYLKQMGISHEPFYYYGLDLNRLDSTPVQKLADAGEAVIFGKVGGFKERGIGKGQCPLCHTFNPGDVGERAPNLFGIIERAEKRIKEPRYLDPNTVQHESFPGSGKAKTADEYIAESHVCPSCYVVEGYGEKGTDDRQSPMVADHKPPIGLTIEEMIFVHTWLHVHNGKTPPLPSQIRKNHEKFIPKNERRYAKLDDLTYSKLEEFTIEELREILGIPPRGIDPITIALDSDTPQIIIQKMGCAACHRIPTIDFANHGIIGPLLISGSNATQRVASPEYQKAIKIGKARARTPKEYIIESIVDPSAFIVPGFPSPGGKSLMPSNFREKFTYSAAEKLADFLLSLDEETAIKEGLDRAPMEKEGSLYH